MLIMAPVHSHEAAVECGANYTHALATPFLSQAPYVAMRRQVLPLLGCRYPCAAKWERNHIVHGAERLPVQRAPGRAISDSSRQATGQKGTAKCAATA